MLATNLDLREWTAHKSRGGLSVAIVPKMGGHDYLYTWQEADYYALGGTYNESLVYPTQLGNISEHAGKTLVCIGWIPDHFIYIEIEAVEPCQS